MLGEQEWEITKIVSKRRGEGSYEHNSPSRAGEAQDDFLPMFSTTQGVAKRPGYTFRRYQYYQYVQDLKRAFLRADQFCDLSLRRSIGLPTPHSFSCLKVPRNFQDNVFLQSRSLGAEPTPGSHLQIMVYFDIQPGLLMKQESADHPDRNGDSLAVHIPT